MLIEKRHNPGASLTGLYAREMRFIDNGDFAGKIDLSELSANLQVETEISDDRLSGSVLLRMTLTHPGEIKPFEELSVAIDGIFRVEATESQQLETFIRRGAPIILMPFVREAIATLTAKSKMGQVLLPPLNVSALLDEAEKSHAPSA